MRIIPLIILGILTCVGLGISIEKHGQPRKGKECAWTSLVAWIIQWGLLLWIIL